MATRARKALTVGGLAAIDGAAWTWVALGPSDFVTYLITSGLTVVLLAIAWLTVRVDRVPEIAAVLDPLGIATVDLDSAPSAPSRQDRRLRLLSATVTRPPVEAATAMAWSAEYITEPAHALEVAMGAHAVARVHQSRRAKELLSALAAHPQDLPLRAEVDRHVVIARILGARFKGQRQLTRELAQLKVSHMPTLRALAADNTVPIMIVRPIQAALLAHTRPSTPRVALEPIRDPAPAPDIKPAS